MTILALYSNKGGVGKTAAAVNLSYMAAQSGLNTLVCDLDPQSSTTFYFRVQPKLKKKAQGLTEAGKAIDSSIKGTDFANLDLLPADFTHRNLDVLYDRMKKSDQRLRKTLRPLEKEYDLIILDCPPVINLVAENIFEAADYLLVPLIPTPLSIRTHEQLLAFLAEQKGKMPKVLTFLSLVDRRKKMHTEFMTKIPNQFTGVMQTAVPYLSQIEQMGIQRQPVATYAPHSPAAQAYANLWAEVAGHIFSGNR
jgi:cellulose biosynthesis protein BcsQ